MLTNKEKIELELHYLSYSRYVSRGHTIFSICAEVLLAIIFGTIGVVLSLVEIRYIPEFNTFHFLRTLEYSGIIIMIIFTVAWHKWYQSRIIRSKIIKRIKELQKKA